MKKLLALALLLLAGTVQADSNGLPVKGTAFHAIPQAGAPPAACVPVGQVCIWYDSNANAWKARDASGSDKAVGGTGTVTSVGCGTGLSGGTITSSGTCSMPNTGPGSGTVGGGSSYVNSVTLDAQGRITGVATGTPAGGISSITAGDGLSGGTITTTGTVKVDPNTVYVLNFPGATSAQHINVGKFYQVGHGLPWTFYWDFWAKPHDSGARYAVIESASGAHALELGFNQSVAGTPNTLLGAINTSPSGASGITFGTDDGILNDEWAHYAVAADGSFIYAYIDGLLCGMVAISGTRQTFNSPNNSNGTILIGGTDHNNYNGELGGYVRGWEGTSPLATPLVGFKPERFATARWWDFVTTFQPANLLITLTAPGVTYFADHSPIGYSGATIATTPSAPTITQGGTPGAASYSYKLVGLVASGHTAVSTAGSTTTGATTLNSTNYNIVTFPTLDARIEHVQVFRTAGGSAQGLVGVVPASAGSFNDTGVTPVDVEAPTSNTSNAGERHPGNLWGSSPGGGGDDDGFPQSGVTTYPVPTWVADSTAPFTRSSSPTAQTVYVPSPSPVPVGAKIFDDFERADQTWAFQNPPSIGSTVAGASLGSLAWSGFEFPATQTTVSHWCVFHGYLRWCDKYAAQGSQVVDSGSATQDIRIDRYVSGSYNLAPGSTAADVGLVFRYVDASNFWYAHLWGAPATLTLRVEKWVSGVRTNTGDIAVPSGLTWTRLRVTASGTTLTFYTGVASGSHDANGFPLYTWTQAGQLTGQTDNQTGTLVGVVMADVTVGTKVTSLARFNNFEAQ